jgi:hypothetical protein
MCLIEIDNSDIEFIKNGKGFKIFIEKDKKLYNNFYSLTGRTILYSREFSHPPLPKNELLIAIEDVVYSPDGKYISGFHIFITQEDAEKYLSEISCALNFKIYEVEYYDAHTKGIDDFKTNVIVAPKMKILKKINKNESTKSMG